MDYKEIIARSIAIEGVSYEELYRNVSRVNEEGMGDYCIPCFKYAKQLRKSPVAIATELAFSLNERLAQLSWLEKVEAVNGYLNFFLNRAQLAGRVLTEVYRKGEHFNKMPANNKTVCIDYSSINIAKPFHIGHLLTTVIGGSLYRIYEHLGYRVVGINHLGDWGTQFGKMIVAYLKWCDLPKEKLSVEELSKLYVRFHEEAEKDAGLNDEARAWFKKLEQGDDEAMRLFRAFKQITLREVKKVYRLLGVEFDSYQGESFFNKKSMKVVELLRQKKLLTTSDGAEVVSLEEEGMPPCLILKSDGTTLYATRDLATAIYRKNTYDFDKCLYIVAYQQELHFKQVFKVLEKMGYEWYDKCEHVPFGMVSLEGEGSLSTRKGKVVYLRDVLETSIAKARETIDIKNSSVKSKNQTAEAIGIGAVIFGALSNNRIKDMAFSYEKALNFDGETAPYLQYTHARCCSVLDKAIKTNMLREKGVIDKPVYLTNDIGLEYLSEEELNQKVRFELLDDPQSAKVIKHLNDFDTIVLDAADKNEPSIISKYLIDLAQSYNKFYMDNRIITDDDDITKARLILTKCVKTTIKNGLRLLLIKAPVRM